MTSRNYYIVIIFIIVFAYTQCKEKNRTKININKCCPDGEFVVEVETDDGFFKKCVPAVFLRNGKSDFSDVPLYNEDKSVTGRNITYIYNLVPGTMINENDTFNSTYTSELNNYYLSEKSVLYVEAPNEYAWWTEHTSDKFCVDYLLDQNSSSVQGYKFWVVYNIINSTEKQAILVNIGLFISCFFLALTLVVYWLLPGTRVLSELIQIAHVASTLGGFFFLSLISIRTYTPRTCLGLSYVTYFLLLASFSWIVVMSFDLWSLHSNKYSFIRSSKRKVLARFIRYSIFGCGVPVAMTGFLIIANHLELRHIPWFIKPNIPIFGCFIDGGEKWLYLYIPMLILMLMNWTFFFLTSYNLWEQYKSTSAVDHNSSSQNSHRSLKNRFLMYLKLSIIMGISWVLEVVSYFAPGFELWYLTDCYNLLTGFSLFLILVCNKKTYKKLKMRFSRDMKDVSIDTEDVK